MPPLVQRTKSPGKRTYLRNDFKVAVYQELGGQSHR